MVIKSYKDVSPSRYEGLSDSVQVREMITAQDGAPTFAMRVFDVTAGAATPYHTHAWEHAVYIVSGTGRVRAGGKETLFKPGDSVYIAPNEDIIREHATRGGFPANAINEVKTIIDPTTAEE